MYDMTMTAKATPQTDYDRETEGMLAVLYSRLAKIQATGRDPWAKR
jgi:hypothetical protein